MSQPQPQNSNPALQFYQKWSEKTPFVTRTFVIATVVEYIISFVLPLENYLGNVPKYTILHYEIYRVLLSPMVGNSLLMLVFFLMSFPTMGSRMELGMGSGTYASVLATISLGTNIAFVLVCYLLYLMGTTSAMYMGCMGSWTMLFALITIECLQVPDAPRRMLFIPVDIPSKYMPLIMYALFCLFSGPQVSYAVSMGMGWLYVQGHLDRFKPSSYALEEAEASGGLLHQVSRNPGWVLSGAALGHDAWVPVNQAGASWAGGGGGSGAGGAMGGGTDGGAGGESAQRVMVRGWWRYKICYMILIIILQLLLLLLCFHPLFT
jgi:uncharacterized membrane protein YgcG